MEKSFSKEKKFAFSHVAFWRKNTRFCDGFCIAPKIYRKQQKCRRNVKFLLTDSTLLCIIPLAPFCNGDFAIQNTGAMRHFLAVFTATGNDARQLLVLIQEVDFSPLRERRKAPCRVERDAKFPVHFNEEVSLCSVPISPRSVSVRRSMASVRECPLPTAVRFWLAAVRRAAKSCPTKSRETSAP